MPGTGRTMRECAYCRRSAVHPCRPIYPWWSWWLCQTCLGLSNSWRAWVGWRDWIVWILVVIRFFCVWNVGWDVIVGDGDDAIFLGDGGGESCRHVDLDDAPAVTNRQFFPESGPVVAVAQRDRIAPWLAVAIELDGDGISTHAAVVDRPFFVGADLCGFLSGKDRRKRCQI